MYTSDFSFQICPKGEERRWRKRRPKEFKDEIFSLITNIISHAHGKISYFRAKSVLTSVENMENSWVSMLTEGNIMAKDF